MIYMADVINISVAAYQEHLISELQDRHCHQVLARSHN